MSSPTPFPQPYNYSIHAIPAAYIFALSPQLYVFARAMKASNYTATNITPRLNIDNLRGKINNNTWQTLVRARGAHLNGLEGFGIFGIAMVRLVTSSTILPALSLPVSSPRLGCLLLTLITI